VAQLYLLDLYYRGNMYVMLFMTFGGFCFVEKMHVSFIISIKRM